MKAASLFLAVLVTTCTPASVVRGQELELREYGTLTVGSVQLAYRDIGSGPPLVLIHGNGNSGVMWDPVVPVLAPHYRLIIPDLRGYGRSTNPTDVFSYSEAARDLIALLDALRIEAVRAVGNSGGAMVLVHLATAAPSRVEAMILQTGTSYFPQHVREMARADAPETWSTESLEDMVRREVAMSIHQARRIRGYFHALKDPGDDMNFSREDLSHISARTLIVHGDRDSYFPVEIAVEQYRSIPRSYLWILPNHDHYVGMPTEVWLDFFSGRWWRPRQGSERR